MIKNVFLLIRSQSEKKEVNDTNQISGAQLYYRSTLMMQEHLGDEAIIEIPHCQNWVKTKKIAPVRRA